jgi:hypothetical protein
LRFADGQHLQGFILLLIWLTLSVVAKARPTKKKLRLNVAPEIAIPSPNVVVMMTLSYVLALRTFLVVADIMMMMMLLKWKPTITIARLWSEDTREKHTTAQLKIGDLWIFHQARNVLRWMVLVAGIKRLLGSATMVLADPNS